MLISYPPRHAFIYGNIIRPAPQKKIRFVIRRVSSKKHAHVHQGYEDDLHETEEEDDDDDASYADEEYGSKKKSSKKRKQPPKPKGTGRHSILIPNTTHKPQTPVVPRPSRPPTESDSDSDYGSRSKKKKRVRTGDEIRVSTRGIKIPNYVDDVEDFETFEADTHPGYYYTEALTQYPQEDEIEQVLSHTRDEGKEGDTEDKFYDNIVGFPFASRRSALNDFRSGSTSSGRTSPICTIRTRRTNS